MMPISSVWIALFISATGAAANWIKEPPSLIEVPGITVVYHVYEDSDYEMEDKVLFLPCKASGNPEPNYRWFKNGFDFDVNAMDRIEKLPKSGTLKFKKTLPEDEGYYQCHATNVHGTSVSNVLTLRKFEAGSFLNSSKVEKYWEKGRPLTLKCDRPLGYPSPQILWNIQDLNAGALTTIDSPRVTFDPEGNLHFSNVTDDDFLNSGSAYTCTAFYAFKNEYKVGIRYILMPESSSRILDYFPVEEQYVSSSNITVLKGNTLELYCVYGGTPLPEITWQKDGDEIFSYPDSGSFNFINYGKTLQIKSVDFKDSGRYKCIASNGGKKKEHEMSVTVSAAPYWLSEPEKKTVDEDGNVTFICGAAGKPFVNLKWYKNGTPLKEIPSDPRSFERIIINKVDEKVEQLTIVNLLEKDTAVYQCNASNSYNYVFKDFFLNVLLMPPEFTEMENNDIKTTVGSNVTIKCGAFAAPKAVIKWYEHSTDKEIVANGTKYDLLYPEENKVYLKIINVSSSHHTKFTCQAQNKVGVTRFTVRIIVTEIKSDPVAIAPTTGEISDEAKPFAKTDWFIGMICAIALVIILAILVCIVKRNRGGNYSVHEKEAALRKDFDGEDGGFDEYSKPIYPTSGAPVGSRTSLTSSLKHGDEKDGDSMTDYGEDDSSKFGEDGSFIGQYVPKGEQSGQTSTGVATFV